MQRSVQQAQLFSAVVGGGVWCWLHAVSRFRRGVLPTLLLGLALGAPGCVFDSDECESGEARCEDGIARVCGPVEHGSRPVMRWSSTGCGSRACVVAPDPTRPGEQQAFCALTATPDPRCTEADGASCDGDALVECRAGHATSVRACDTRCITLDDRPDYCLEAPPSDVGCVSGSGCELAGAGFSAIKSSAPAASCSSDELSAPGDPSTRVYAYRCQDGLLVERHHCAASCLLTTTCGSACAGE